MGRCPLAVSAFTSAPASTRRRTNSGFTWSPRSSRRWIGVAPSASRNDASTPRASARCSAVDRPSKTISCRIVVKRSPSADNSIRRPASAPRSMSASAASGCSDCTAYHSGVAPQASCTSGSMPAAIRSATEPHPLRARSNTESTSGCRGSVHGGGATPSAANTRTAPGRRSRRSYQGHGPSPFAA